MISTVMRLGRLESLLYLCSSDGDYLLRAEHKELTPSELLARIEVLVKSCPLPKDLTSMIAMMYDHIEYLNSNTVGNKNRPKEKEILPGKDD